MTSKLAEQLTALMSYRNAPDHEPEPLQSNWTTTPANDNADPEEVADFGVERNLLVTPSVVEIMRQVRLGPVERGAVAPVRKGLPPASQGPIVGVGRLRFSDGTQTEKAYTVGPDGDMIQYDRQMETGAMLYTVEKPHTAAGGRGYSEADLARSNAFHADVLNTAAARYVRRTKRRNGPSLTPAQSRALIDEAIANTPVMPPVKRYAAGLPCGSERVGDSFVAFQKVPSGESGSVAWEDVAWTIENAKVWRNVRKALRSRDVAVLDAAMRAQNFEEVGVAAGQSPLYANKRGGGRRALLAANENLTAAIRKFAA
jgi:hypothetical protein